LFKVLEVLSDGKGEEERGEEVALSKAGGGDLVQVLPVGDYACVRLSVRPGMSSEELGSMSLKGNGSVGSRGFVEGVGEVEGVEVGPCFDFPLTWHKFDSYMTCRR
jgi:hypothetical protein